MFLCLICCFTIYVSTTAYYTSKGFEALKWSVGDFFSVRIPRTTHQGFFPSAKARTLMNTFPKEHNRVRWDHRSRGILAGCTSAVMNAECKRGELISVTEDSEADSILYSQTLHKSSVQRQKLSFGLPCFYLMNRSGKGYLISRSQTGRGREHSRLTRRDTKTDKLLDDTVAVLR